MDSFSRLCFNPTFLRLFIREQNLLQCRWSLESYLWEFLRLSLVSLSVVQIHFALLTPSSSKDSYFIVMPTMNICRNIIP